ncbi:MAG: nitric oxide reductase activation protein [Lachnospiraceae bacterium]|nr:nitric oxide reductase activation protein [Lachnospiraceae bacterium]
MDTEWYDSQENELETENRIKNLMWTVSGDYALNTKLDVASFSRSKYISMYDAVKQGAFARFFDKDQFAMYLVKKVFCGAEEGPLMNLAQMCVETAVYPKILLERPGVKEIREKAFEALLDGNFKKLSETLPGQIKLALMRGTLDGKWDCVNKVGDPLSRIRSLEQATDAMKLIEAVDQLYNTVIDRNFEKKYGSLRQVLDTPLEDLKEFNWKDFLNEEMYEDVMEQYVSQMSNQLTSFDQLEQEPEEKKRSGGGKKIVVLDEEAISKMYGYMELNYGKSYLTEQEQRSVNYRLCRGAHAGCSLYYTDGILTNPVLSNAQYVNAKKHAEKNRLAYRNHQNMIKRSIEYMTDSLRRSLVLRSQKDQILARDGTIIPKYLWKIGRTDPGKLFFRTTRQNSSEFVVDVLMDASGSQRDRQSQVALQAYIISEALSSIQIPHRIMSFCTFWDYTVMQRFREYDAPRLENRKVLEYTTSSNNRDGLAIRAAGDTLCQRPEENKILIILSDGRPNDVTVNRPNSRNPEPYFGDYAVRDTAFEVRKLRGQGIFVLGVFSGKEKDLPAEKMIFGKDFAYIHQIQNFSRVVSSYLQKLLEQDAEE